MSEWWSYRPQDFLMFAPRTYWRLFELHNQDWWPLQALLPLAALIWLAWMRWPMRHRRGGPGGSTALRVAALGLALALVAVVAGFMLPRYAPINWAAPAFAAGLVVLALVLSGLAMQPGLQPAPGAQRMRCGVLLWVWAWCGHPLLALAAARPWMQAEWVGLAPDPTVLAVLGWLLCSVGAPHRLARLLRGAAWALALAWCVISGATLATMGSAQAGVLLAAAMLALVARRH